MTGLNVLEQNDLAVSSAPASAVGSLSSSVASSSPSTAATSTSPSMPGAHIPFLDGLRGLAVLWVMTFHSHGWISRQLFRGGDWVGIDVFFVLSGFLITRILLGEQAKTGSIDLKKFYFKRVLRLFPAFAVYLLIIGMFNPNNHGNIFAAIAVAMACMSDLDIAYHWGHVAGSGLDITWSLSVEEKFYAFWPVLIRHLRRYLPAIAATTIICGLIWKAIVAFQYPVLPRPCEAIDTRGDTIMLGCLAALALSNQNWLKRLSSTLGHRFAPAVLLSALFIYVRYVGVPSTVIEDRVKLLLHWDLRMLIFDSLVACLIVALFLRPQSVASRIMGSSFMRWSGKISYSLYLWHVVAYTLIAGRVTGYPAEFAGYGLAFAFAALSFYLIEQPFLALKDKLGR